MIRVRDVSKRFLIHHQRATELKERIVGRLKGRRFETEEFWALRQISFHIGDGESVALIGANGSGKSTLLQIIARILVPDGGEVTVGGRVAALLELGAGFNPELTGRENVYLAAAIMGFSRREIEWRMREIIEFSELERFIDTPIKNYSTGMYMRLGFSVATHVDPDILLIDEILAVGDEAFQAKCIRRIEEFKRRGKTLVFVSHSMDAVRRICGRAILLDNGRLALQGSPDEAIRHYFAILGIAPEAPAPAAPEPAPATAPEDTGASREAPALPAGTVYLELCQWVGPSGQSQETPEGARGLLARVCSERPAPPTPTPIVERPASAATPSRFGIGLLRVERVEILGAADEPDAIESDGPLAVRIHYATECIVRRPVVGVAIHASDGSHLMGPNTKAHGVTIPLIEGRGTIDWKVDHLPLAPGDYLLTVAFFNHAIDVVYDFCDKLFPFSVAGAPRAEQGWLSTPSRFEIAAPDGQEPCAAATLALAGRLEGSP